MRVVCAVLSLSACSPHPSLAPGTFTAERDGIVLSADANAWSAKPHDINRFAVALAIEVRNQGTLPIAVRGEDFALFVGGESHQRAADGTVLHVRKTLARLLPRGSNENLQIVAQHPPRIPGDDAMLASGEFTERASQVVEREEWAESGRFLVYRGPQIYFQGPINYFGTPDDFYLVAHPAPASDLGTLSLADGVLAPGETRTGFLYFARPEGSARTFTLIWRAAPLDATSMEDGEAEPLALSFAR